MRKQAIAIMGKIMWMCVKFSAAEDIGTGNIKLAQVAVLLEKCGPAETQTH